MGELLRRRRIGHWEVETDALQQPEGWTYVRVLDLNGAPVFVGVVPTEDVALEIVLQLERAREYEEALRRPSGGS